MAEARQEILQQYRLLAEIPDDLLQGAVPLIREALINADSPEAAIVFLASVYRTLLGSLLAQRLPESCRTVADVERLCRLAHAEASKSRASSDRFSRFVDIVDKYTFRLPANNPGRRSELLKRIRACTQQYIDASDSLIADALGYMRAHVKTLEELETGLIGVMQLFRAGVT